MRQKIEHRCYKNQSNIWLKVYPKISNLEISEYLSSYKIDPGNRTENYMQVGKKKMTLYILFRLNYAFRQKKKNSFPYSQKLYIINK